MKVVKDSFEKCQFYNVQFSNKEMSGAKDHGHGGVGGHCWSAPLKQAGMH